MKTFFGAAAILFGTRAAFADDAADCHALANRLAASSGARITDDVGVRLRLEFPRTHIYGRIFVDIICPVKEFGASISTFADRSDPDAVLLMVTLAGAFGFELTGAPIREISETASKCIAARVDGDYYSVPLRLPNADVRCGPPDSPKVWVEVAKPGYQR